MEVVLSSMFGTLACLSAILVILAKNPIHSVLYLIVVFLNSTGILLLLKVEFVAMLFLIVYVGAIAILFLFVVMMLNIKRLDENISRYVPVGVFLTIILLVESALVVTGEFAAVQEVVLQDWESKLSSLNNIQALGQVLYTHYSFLVLVAGMILLLAMMGAIVLTLHKRGAVYREVL